MSTAATARCASSVSPGPTRSPARRRSRVKCTTLAASRSPLGSTRVTMGTYPIAPGGDTWLEQLAEAQVELPAQEVVGRLVCVERAAVVDRGRFGVDHVVGADGDARGAL